MSLSFEQVGTNLHELLIAKHENRSLTAGYYGNDVKAVVWYRWVIVVIYKIIDLCRRESWEKRNLKSALEKTTTAFKENLPRLEAAFQRYRQFLDQLLAGNEIDWAEFNQCKRTLTVWSSKLVPLFEQFEKRPDVVASINQLYRSVFAEQGVQSPLEVPRPRDLISDIERYQHLIDFESLMSDVELCDESENYSYAILRRLCRGDNIEEGDPDFANLKKWIKKLNYAYPYVNELDLALRAFVKHCNPEAPPEVIEDQLANLEWSLKKHGCKILDEVDDEFITLRKQLESDHPPLLFCNGAGIHIGQRLGDRKKDDRCAVYTIENNVECVVEIGRNAADLRIKWKESERNPRCVPMVRLRALDRSGKCAIVQRLHRQVSFQWQTPSHALKVSEQDMGQLRPLANMIALMVAKKQTPQNLSLKYLMLDENHQIRTTQLLQEGPFDFLKVLKIVEAIASGNACVFRALLEESGLNVNEHARYLYMCLSRRLKGMPSDAEIVASAFLPPIRCPHVVARAKELQEKSEKILKETVGFLMQEEPRFTPKMQKDLAILAIHSACEASYTYLDKDFNVGNTVIDKAKEYKDMVVEIWEKMRQDDDWTKHKTRKCLEDKGITDIEVLKAFYVVVHME